MRRSIAPVLLATFFIMGCGAHYHGHQRSPGYHHEHRLRCGHYVSCRFRGGEHHYRPHYRHRDDYHRHVVRGHFVPCPVLHGRNYHRGWR